MKLNVNGDIHEIAEDWQGESLLNVLLAQYI